MSNTKGEESGCQEFEKQSSLMFCLRLAISASLMPPNTMGAFSPSTLRLSQLAPIQPLRCATLLMASKGMMRDAVASTLHTNSTRCAYRFNCPSLLRILLYRWQGVDISGTAVTMPLGVAPLPPAFERGVVEAEIPAGDPFVPACGGVNGADA